MLNVRATTRDEAVQVVARSLQGDSRITDWPAFLSSLSECARSSKINMGLGLTIPHNRTDSVATMVMAFGRLAEPIHCGTASIRFVLVIGIPETMDADYLRVVGVLMRSFRDDELRHRLETAATPEAVLSTLERVETKLVQ